MKVLYLFISLTFFSFFSFSQNRSIEEYKSLLKKEKFKEKKLQILDSLNRQLMNKGKIEEGLPYFEEMSVIAKELDRYELESRAYKYISEYYMKKVDSLQSKSFAQKALSLSSKENDIKIYLLDLNQLGRVYHHFQNYKMAIATYKKAIDKFESINSEKRKDYLSIISVIYSNLSTSYQKIGENDKSIQMNIKGVDIAKESKNNTGIAYGYYSLGYKYMNIENYSKAEEYFLKSLTFSDSVNLKTYANMNHHALGINYSRWGKYDKAIENNKKALAFYKKQGDKLYQFDVLNNMAVVYNKLEDYESGVEYGEKALEIAQEVNHKLAINGAKLTLAASYINLSKFENSKQYLLDVAADTLNTKMVSRESKAGIYANLSRVYEGLNKYKLSLDYQRKFQALNDSIQKEKLDSKFADIENKYQLEQKNNEILSKSIKLEKESKKNLKLSFLLIILTIALVILSFLIYKHRKRIELERSKYLKEVEKVSKLNESLSKKDRVSKSVFFENLKKKYDLTEALLEYWIFQVQGITEEKMRAQLKVSKDAIKSRRSRLYGKLKEIEDIDTSIRLSKSDSVRIYRENQLLFSN